MATPPVYSPPPPAKATKKGVKTPVSRMAPRLAPKAKAPPPIPLVYDLSKTQKAIAKVAKKKVTIKLGGRAPVDDHFEAEVHFSPAFGDDAGESYSEPLVNPTGAKDYYMRCRIAQHRVDPLLQGFSTKWVLPAGWTFVDGQPSTIYDEAISNPLVIVRVIHSPASPVAAGFRVIVVTKYKP